MTFLARYLDRLRRKPPVIHSQWGDVTESARHAAALNMYDDPGLRHRVEEVVINELGGDIARGLAECKRRYPEAYR